MENTHNLGAKIEAIREQRKLTPQKLAELSQVSVNMISKLEAGEMAPSLAPLLKISRALGVRLGTFLDDAPKSEPVVVKAGKTDKIMRFTGSKGSAATSSLDFFSLGAEKKDRHMEPFIVDVKPAGDERAISSHEGEEFIYVLSGEIEVYYGKETFQLYTGDSIYYDSVVSHYLHSLGSEEAKILAVVYTPV